MPDSLNLAGQWELMSQAVDPDSLPPVAGPPPDAEIPVVPQPYELVLGYDLGSPVPVTTTILGDLLDGDRVAGTRTGNRTVTLPITVTAVDRRTLSMLTDQLVQSVNVSTFPLQWWPADGDPMVWDCFRATCTVEWDVRLEGPLGSPGFQRLVTVTCSALPFGRSTDRETVDAAATPFILDQMDATAPVGASLDTVRSHDGNNSARVDAVFHVSHWGNYYDGSVLRKWNGPPGTPPKDLTGYRAVTFWVYVDSRAVHENMAFFLRLRSDATDSMDEYVILQPTMNTQSWRLVSFPVGTRHASNHTGRKPVDYSRISQYQLYFRDYRKTWATCGTCSTHSSHLRVNIDTMTGVPSSSIALQTVNGALLTVPGVIGTARAPVSLHLTSPIDTGGMLIHRPPNTADPDAVILAPLDTGVAGQTVTIPKAGSGYDGTYTIVVALQGSNAANHHATVTVNQRITSANTVIATEVISRDFTIGGTGPHPYAVIGQVTLPLRAIPADSTSSSFTINVTLNAGDTGTDLMLLDTRGQTVIATLPRVVTGLWIDEPDPQFGVGLVLVAAAQDNRAGCYGVMDSVQISGGPFALDPGDNLILVHSTGGVPDLTADYAPRWLAERSSGQVLQAGDDVAVAVRNNPAFAGDTSRLTVTAPVGTPVLVISSTVAGATAHLTHTAPAGTVAAGGSTNLAGTVSTATYAAPAGVVNATRNVTLTGAVATLTHAAPAGTVAATNPGLLYRTGATGGTTTSTTNNFNITIPSAAHVGDLAVVSCCLGGNIAMGTLPSGWTQQKGTVNAQLNIAGYVLTKTLVSGDINTTTNFPVASGTWIAAVCDVIGNASEASFTSPAWAVGTGTSVTSPTVTVPTSGWYLGVWMGATTTGGSFTFTADGTLTFGQSYATSVVSGNNRVIGTAWKTAAGSTAGAGCTFSASTGRDAAYGIGVGP